MTVLRVVALTLVGVGATAVVLTRVPSRQVVVIGVFGLALALLFFVVQAPDVALSQLTVGAVILPLVVLLVLRKVEGGQR